MNIDKRHNGPYDRGSADRYYGRQFHPHYYNDGIRIEVEDMTKRQRLEYKIGWNQTDDRKDWGDGFARQGSDVAYTEEEQVVQDYL